MSQTTLTVPTYLRDYLQHGTIVCTEHRLGYQPQSLINHLVNVHKVKGSQKKATEGWLKQLNFSTRVTEPAHYDAPILGLEVLTEWQCNVCQHATLSQSRQTIERHCSKQHHLDSKRRIEERGAILQASMQRWFAKSNKYWIVDLSHTFKPTTTTKVTTPTTPSQQALPPSSPSTIRRPSVASSTLR